METEVGRLKEEAFKNVIAAIIEILQRAMATPHSAQS